MDPRVRDHAEILVDHSTAVAAGDNVIVNAPIPGEELAVALAAVLGERGAITDTRLRSPRSRRAYLRNVDEDALVLNEMRLGEIEAADALISVRGDYNTHETADVPPATNRAIQAANKEIQELVMDDREWVVTQYPAPGNAQDAELSTAGYEDFVWNAVLKDWDAVREHQEQLVEVLAPASEVRIASGETTDVRMAVDGMLVRNDHGQSNMPGGEVFTAPVPDSVEGEVLFDKPVLVQGREVTDVRLAFEDGEVVEHDAAKNVDVLTTLLETDDGARRVGELGIGMNRDIDRFTYNTLFDEKMGDTVHMALGRAYEETVGDDRERNDSAVHQDMIVDMSDDSVIEVDGEVIQRDGTFRFEVEDAAWDDADA